jgi:hypothetical protein
VGAGEVPSVILMVGARSEEEQMAPSREELAARYGASAEEDTSDPEQAYAWWEEPRLGRPVLGPPFLGLIGPFRAAQSGGHSRALARMRLALARRSIDQLAANVSRGRRRA